jgi:hypothetical protein
VNFAPSLPVLLLGSIYIVVSNSVHFCFLWLNICRRCSRRNDAQRILRLIVYYVCSIKTVWIFLFFSVSATSLSPAKAIELHTTELFRSLLTLSRHWPKYPSQHLNQVSMRHCLRDWGSQGGEDVDCGLLYCDFRSRWTYCFIFIRDIVTQKNSIQDADLFKLA